MLWTLRYGDDVRDEKDYFAHIEKAKPEPHMRALMEKLSRAHYWDGENEGQVEI